MAGIAHSSRSKVISRPLRHTSKGLSYLSPHTAQIRTTRLVKNEVSARYRLLREQAPAARNDAVREGNTEGIHQMRVGLRRLRAPNSHSRRIKPIPMKPGSYSLAEIALPGTPILF